MHVFLLDWEVWTYVVAIFLSLVQLDGEGNVIRESGAWAVPELVVWAEEETVGESIAEEEAVVDASTGESVSAEVVEVKWVGKGNKVYKVEHQKAQKSWVVEELEEVTAFDGGRWGWWLPIWFRMPPNRWIGATARTMVPGSSCGFRKKMAAPSLKWRTMAQDCQSKDAISCLNPM